MIYIRYILACEYVHTQKRIHVFIHAFMMLDVDMICQDVDMICICIYIYNFNSKKHKYVQIHIYIYTHTRKKKQLYIQMYVCK